jgi:hypothetical protein
MRPVIGGLMSTEINNGLGRSGILNKAVNRTFFASLRFGVASPLYTKTPLHKKCPLQRRYVALQTVINNEI